MIEIGTKVKVKEDNIKYIPGIMIDPEKIYEISQITNDAIPRYRVIGFYFYGDSLEIFSKDEFPEYYI